jgi:site-specific recombinase XerD
MQSVSPEQALSLFVDGLIGRNAATGTITAYQSSIRHFLAWLREMDGEASISDAGDISRQHVAGYLTALGHRGLSGAYRRRHMAALRAYFTYLVDLGVITRAPTTGVPLPKKERSSRESLRPDEYRQLLQAATGNRRDYCIVQLFLQTGIRVAELCALTTQDIDLVARCVVIREGKGMKARTLPLEKKAVAALENHLGKRPMSTTTALFLNRYGEPLSERGVRKLIGTYARRIDVRKPIQPHVLRHTYIDVKASFGVPAVALQKLAGHTNLNTTQGYIHDAADRMDLARIQENSSL